MEDIISEDGDKCLDNLIERKNQSHKVESFELLKEDFNSQPHVTHMCKKITPQKSVFVNTSELSSIYSVASAP